MAVVIFVGNAGESDNFLIMVSVFSSKSRRDLPDCQMFLLKMI